MKYTFETVKENTFGKILTLLGTLIGIIGLFATIFFGLNDTIIKNEPRFEYDIISETDFLNNSESTPYIKVFIEDTIDVQENHYNITAYSIKIENKGKKHISYRDYDEGFFGLKIDKGILLDVPILLSASNESIIKNFHTDTIAKGNSEIEIPKLSLDIGDNYVIKIVLLHNADSIPEFHREGKIVGQKSIDLNPIQKPTPSFWSMTFEGIWWVQLIRLVSYSIFGFAIVLAVVSLVDKIQENNRKRIAKKAIEQREEDIIKLNIIPSIKDEYIKNIRIPTYYSPYFDDSPAINKIQKLYFIYTNDNEAKITERYQKMVNFINQRKYYDNFNDEEFNRVREEYNEYNDFIKKNYFILHDMSITFHKDAKESVMKLFDFLINKKQKPSFADYKPRRSVDEILNVS